MRNRRRTCTIISALIAAAIAAPLGASGAPGASGATASVGEVSITVHSLRSAEGQVLACLTASEDGFPDCSKDRHARKAAVAVGPGGSVSFAFKGVAPGSYAVSVLHDENGNGKADKALFIPKEGFGFSRDARVKMGPPRFDAAAFTVGAGKVHQVIRMRYMFR